MTRYEKGSFGLDGRACVVTGGGSGIGRAVALALAEEGARVAVLDRNVKPAEDTADLIVKAGGQAIALGCDISDQEQVEKAATAVSRRYGDIDVLVNNAGIIKPGTLDTLPLADWNLLLSVNLTGYFICSQAFGRSMLQRGEGALVHVSSMAAVAATPIAGSYSVGKAPAFPCCRACSRSEWGPRGIRSNAVLPGMTVTPMVEAVWKQPGVVESRSAIIPSRRPGSPEDIAQAVLFLASGRCLRTSMAPEILVDGGLNQSLMTLIPRPGFEKLGKG